MRLSKSIRYLAVSSATALSAGLLTVPSASAATEYFESFTDADVTYSSDWAAGRFSLGTLLDYPCLTARPAASGDLQLNPGPGTIFDCSTTPDAPGSGVLRLADDSTTAAPDSSDVTFTQPFLTSGGFDITFSMAMFDTSSTANEGADGISFFLKDGSSTNYAPGYPGGWLGYINIDDALLGVGFDYFGNFSQTDTTLKLQEGCSTDGPGQRPNSIAVRGPGVRSASDPYNGYCYIAGTSSNAMNFSSAENTREAATRQGRIQVDSPNTVNPKVRVYFDNLTSPILTVDQPAELQQSQTFKFGFAGSSGGAYAQFLEIWDLRFTGTPVPPPPPAVQMITLDIDANEGSCTISKITEPVDTWADLPGEDACTREGYEFLGFDTSASSTTPQFAPGAPVQLTGNNRVYAIYEEIVPEPFMCTPDLIQVSGTGGGLLYVYDPTRNTMDLVPDGGGPDKAPGANAIGYNPADGFIYGIAPNGADRNLWKFGSNGVYEDLGPIIDTSTGAPVQNLSLISGDFIAGDLLLAIQRPNRMLTVDVAPTRSGLPAQATLQTLPRGVWDAADIAFTADRTAGYGINNNNLFIATLPGGDAASQVAAVGQGSTFTRKAVLGVPRRGNYGAAYLDQNNNAYFYNNEERRIYLITAAELAKDQPRAVPLGTEKAFVLGTDQTLQVPTDGASCATAPIITVTLTYDINGGEGETPGDQTGFVDQEVTVADGVGFEKDSAVFAGWNTAADGSGANYTPGALFDLGASGGKLYAMWKPVEKSPPVPLENILEPIVEPEPPAEEGEEITFTPIEELPAPPGDPWKPSSLVLIDPDGGNPTPVVRNETGDWSVNNRIAEVTYVPEPSFSGPAQMTVQLQTESGVRYQTTLQTQVPSCEVGQRVRATVYFDVLSSEIDAKSRRTLNRLVRQANARGVPTCSVVVGFVQPTPNRSNDVSLSTSRAESVADYLEDRGITRIVRTEGLGRADQQGAKARRATATIYIAPPPPAVPADE